MVRGRAADAPAFEKALSGYYRERTEEEQRMRGSSAIMCWKRQGLATSSQPHTLASTKGTGYCEYSSRPYTGRMEGSGGSQSLY